jgi:glycosyltransferase involved in cell wall biosynthesis
MKLLNNPLISVILPVFNAVDYVSESIESILQQTLGDFELILIDDGSTDDSLRVLENYASRDPRIILVSRPNKGLIASLNEGVQIARGSWIARMDADDISHPERFQSQLDHIMLTGADICGSFIELFDDYGWNRKKQYFQHSNELMIETMFGTPIAHGSVFLKSNILKEFPYRAEFIQAEDYDLWARCIIAGKQIVNVPKFLYKYRAHRNQVSNVYRTIQQDTASKVQDYYVRNIAFNSLHCTSVESQALVGLLCVSEIRASNIPRSDLILAMNKVIEMTSNEDSRLIIIKRFRNIYLHCQCNFFNLTATWNSFYYQKLKKVDWSFSWYLLIIRALKIKKSSPVYKWLGKIWLHYFSR